MTQAIITIVVDLDSDKTDVKEVLDNGMTSKPLSALSEAAWSMGVLVSREVQDYDEWSKGEIACADADEQRGHRRAVLNLVEPAHEQLDMLEPCPPRIVSGGTLTPAARIQWYREHQEEA